MIGKKILQHLQMPRITLYLPDMISLCVEQNYTPYDGDASFLEGPTEATNKLWGKLQELQKEERAKGGVLDMETDVVTSLTAYGPGYIDEI